MEIDSSSVAPEDCANLDEIRAGMDQVDRHIIAWMARRVAYVRAAAQFKSSATAVAAPERVQAVLNTRREWAEQAGLDGAVVEELYRRLVAYCIAEEGRSWEKLNPK